MATSLRLRGTAACSCIVGVTVRVLFHGVSGNDDAGNTFGVPSSQLWCCDRLVKPEQFIIRSGSLIFSSPLETSV